MKIKASPWGGGVARGRELQRGCKVFQVLWGMFAGALVKTCTISPNPKTNQKNATAGPASQSLHLHVSDLIAHGGSQHCAQH